jgi:hypothetical protein
MLLPLINIPISVILRSFLADWTKSASPFMITHLKFKQQKGSYFFPDPDCLKEHAPVTSAYSITPLWEQLKSKEI